MLNRYETYHLADGRTLKLPPDKGEGQQWAHKPGNLYSTPIKLHVDAGASGADGAACSTKEIGPIKPKTDTEFVRHIRIRSELLSQFLGPRRLSGRAHAACRRASTRIRRRTIR